MQLISPSTDDYSTVAGKITDSSSVEPSAYTLNSGDEVPSTSLSTHSKVAKVQDKSVPPPVCFVFKVPGKLRDNCGN